MKLIILDWTVHCRESLLEEFAKKKALELQITEEKKRKRKADKKEAVNLGSIKNNMSKLLEKLSNADKIGDIVTPDSTDNDSEDDDAKNPSIVLTVGEKTDENEVITTEEELVNDANKKEL